MDGWSLGHWPFGLSPRSGGCVAWEDPVRWRMLSASLAEISQLRSGHPVVAITGTRHGSDLNSRRDQLSVDQTIDCAIKASS
jgi:hypothetical protein